MSAPSMAAQATRYSQELWRRRSFVWELSRSRIQSRNVNTTMGHLWWALNPLLLAMTYFVVFGLILGGKRGEPVYLAYLLSGMFPFYYTSQSMRSGPNLLTANAKLVTNVRFPRMILPIAAVIESSTSFAASMIIYFLIAGPLAGFWPSPVDLLLLPVVMAFQTLFNVGLAALFARMAVPFRDIANLTPFMTRIWLYLSPVIWTIDELQDAVPTSVLQVNPMYSILQIYRYLLLGDPLAASTVWIAIGWCLVMLVIGTAAFTSFEKHIVKYL